VDGVELLVWAKPRASRTEVFGIRKSPQGEALEVRLAASPAEEAANLALPAFLASALRIPVRDVQLLQGASARMKCVRILGLGPEDVVRRLFS
jgi:uncharacterized protein YggU (UPF0235/DUF167 family)